SGGAHLLPDDDRVFGVVLRSVDGAGNMSTEAFLGPEFGPRAVNELLADVSPPAWGEPQEPAQCQSQAPTTYGFDATTGTVTEFSWSEPSPLPDRYLFVLELPFHPTDIDCQNNPWACKADLRCGSGSCSVCTSHGVEPTAILECVGSTSQLCLRP